MSRSTARESRFFRDNADAAEYNVCRDQMKVRDVAKLLEKDGWFIAAMRGSHRRFKHKTKPGRVTVAGKAKDDLAPGTLNSILKQAQMKGRG